MATLGKALHPPEAFPRPPILSRPLALLLGRATYLILSFGCVLKFRDRVRSRHFPNTRQRVRAPRRGCCRPCSRPETLAPPRPSPVAAMAQWDSPPSAPAGLLAKLDRIAREPPPIPPRISQHPFYAESTPWTDVPAATRPELDRLGLWDSVRHLKDKGYAVIPDPAPASDIVALREAVASGWSSRPKVTTALLGVDPVYELAATNPVVAAMAEASLGQGFLLSSMGSSRVRQVDDDPAKRRTQGEELHCDQFMLPAPFPLQSQTLVFCWALNCPFTPENGPPPPLPLSPQLCQPSQTLRVGAGCLGCRCD